MVCMMYDPMLHRTLPDRPGQTRAVGQSRNFEFTDALRKTGTLHHFTPLFCTLHCITLVETLFSRMYSTVVTSIEVLTTFSEPASSPCRRAGVLTLLEFMIPYLVVLDYLIIATSQFTYL